jgi:RimJ/RimL family protein N-acetyltransferase
MATALNSKRMHPLAPLHLRTTTLDDLAFVLHAERHPDNCPFVNQWSLVQHAAACHADDSAHYVIEQVTEGARVGYCILQGLTDSDQSVCLRRLVITEKGRGYGRQALRLIKHKVFAELYAHRLWLDVMEHNQRARYLYEAEGFVYEGILRECARSADGFVSFVIMSILAREYNAAS